MTYCNQMTDCRSWSA